MDWRIVLRSRILGNERCHEGMTWVGRGGLAFEYTLDKDMDKERTVVQAFPVHSIEVANRFYTKVLGCGETRFRSPYLQDYPLFGHRLVAHFAGDDYRCEDEDVGSAVRFPHFGVRVPQHDFAETVRRLEKHGVDYAYVSAPYFDGQTAVFFRDPSGNNVYVHGADLYPPRVPGGRRPRGAPPTPDVADHAPPSPDASPRPPPPPPLVGAPALPRLPERSGAVSKSGRRGLATRALRGREPATVDVDGMRWSAGPRSGERVAVPVARLEARASASPTRSDPGSKRPRRRERHRRSTADSRVSLPAARRRAPSRARSRRPAPAKPTALPAVARMRASADWRAKAGNAEDIWDQYQLKAKQRQLSMAKAWTCAFCNHSNDPAALDVDGDANTCDSCSAPRVMTDSRRSFGG